MARPRRLYKSGDKYYYLIKGKKVFVKIPEKVSQKQIQKVNIRNIITIPEARRVKRKRRTKGLKYAKKVDKDMIKTEEGLASYYSFKPERKIKEIQDQFASNIEKTKDTTVDKLTDVISKLAIQSRLPMATIEDVSKVAELGSVGGTFGRQEFANLPEDQRKMASGFIVSSGLPTPYLSPIGTSPTGRILSRSEESKEDNTKRESKEQDRPVYSKPSRQQREEFLKRGESAVMPSLRSKPNKSIPSSFSASTSGTDFPAGIPKSDAELAREEARSFVNPSKGAGDVENGLYTDEVETIARKRLKYFVPVIPNDQTNELMKYVKRGDKEFAFIINTDNSDQGGRHWRCVYIDNRDDYKTVEWYDPLTETAIPENVRQICKRICMKMNSEMLFKFKSNAIRQQAKTSSRCGIHCIRFLEARHNGIPFSVASGYDSFINELKSKGELDGSVEGEKELSKKVPIYSSYI